ncbi:hypothetical protein I4U23_004501 [Adineta vaga]|nr:hypothetical protein I4U23_004501 [Adineta vaga]
MDSLPADSKSESAPLTNATTATNPNYVAELDPVNDRRTNNSSAWMDKNTARIIAIICFIVIVIVIVAAVFILLSKYEIKKATTISTTTRPITTTVTTMSTSTTPKATTLTSEAITVRSAWNLFPLCFGIIILILFVDTN